MIKVRHTKYYERKIQSNKLEYITTAVVYCTTHDVKVPFGIPNISCSKIINHPFHVEKDKVYARIGFDWIIGNDLMVQLGLTANFKRQVLQWDGATVPME